MTTCAATTIATERRAALANGRAPARAGVRRWLATALLLVALALLAACAGKPVRPTIARGPLPAPATPTPARPTPPPPAASTPPPLPARRNFEQEKARIKAALAKNPQDSLAASEVGYYLDVLLGRIKQSTGKSIGVARAGQRIVVVLPAGAGFEIGSVALSPAMRQTVARLGRVLVEYRRVLITVRVRPDQSVIGASNPKLTELRAQALSQYLTDLGVASARVVIAPAVPGRPGTGAPARARIEFELEPVIRLTARPRSRS